MDETTSLTMNLMHPFELDDGQSVTSTVASEVDQGEQTERVHDDSDDPEESKDDERRRMTIASSSTSSSRCNWMARPRSLLLLSGVVMTSCVVIVVAVFYGLKPLDIPTISAIEILTNPGLAILHPTNPGSSNSRAFHFGQTVAIHGNDVIVCAPTENMIESSFSESKHGSCSIFHRSTDDRWAFKKKCFGLDGWEFGTSVALGNGVALVGVVLVASTETVFTGSIVPLTMQDETSEWKMEVPIERSNTAPVPLFGSAVSISNSVAIVYAGNTAAAGFPEGASNDDDTNKVGGVYYYVRSNETSKWELVDSAIVAFGNDEVDIDVSITNHTSLISVVKTLSGAGAVLVRRSSATHQNGSNANFTHIATLLPDDLSSESSDFGASIAMIDEKTVVVGAPRSTSTSGHESGAAYIFREARNGRWIQIQVITPPGSNRDRIINMSRVVAATEEMIVLSSDVVQENGKQKPGVTALAYTKDEERVWKHTYNMVCNAEDNDESHNISSLSISSDWVVVLGVSSAHSFQGAACIFHLG